MLRSVLLAGAVAAVLAVSPAARTAETVLRATVGPDSELTITLRDAAGAPVKRLEPGTYTLVVDDEGATHNFHLHGPGVHVDTGQAATGRRTFTVELREGYYRFVCDPHADDMHGAFTVGDPPPADLRAHVAERSIALTRTDGSAVDAIVPGRHVIAVEDRTSVENFHLAGPGVDEHTQVHSRLGGLWTLDVVDGVYHYFSDRSPARLHGTLRVGTPPAAPAEKTLRALVGPDIVISLLRADYSPAIRIPAGAYMVLVDDGSPDQNFRLSGPGVARATSVAGISKEEWRLVLRPGVYRYVSEPHAAGMFGSLTVFSTAAPTTVTATLAANGRIVLRAPGALRPGPYVLRVRDASRRTGFVFRGPGVSRRTGAAFTGTVTWRVQLVRGT